MYSSKKHKCQFCGHATETRRPNGVGGHVSFCGHCSALSETNGGNLKIHKLGTVAPVRKASSATACGVCYAPAYSLVELYLGEQLLMCSQCRCTQVY